MESRKTFVAEFRGPQPFWIAGLDVFSLVPRIFPVNDSPVEDSQVTTTNVVLSPALFPSRSAMRIEVPLYGSVERRSGLCWDICVAIFCECAVFANDFYLRDLEYPICRECVDPRHFSREDVVVVPLSYPRVDEGKHWGAGHDDAKNSVPHLVEGSLFRILDEVERVVRPEDANISDRDEEQER